MIVHSEQVEPDTIRRSIVALEPGRLAWTVDEAEAIILQNYTRWGLYQRGPFLVRVAMAHPEPKSPVRRAPGAIILRTATVPMLQDIFNRAIEWRKLKPGFPLATAAPTDCPTKVANTYLSRGGLWRLPRLTGIVQAPLLRPDGTVLTRHGFDEQTGLLLHSDLDWPALPMVSHDAVQSAVKTLLAPFSEFPYTAEDRSVLVSAILTALQRRLLYSAPLHAFDAPTPASGKSLITDSVALIATGLTAASFSANTDEEELRKKLVSILIASDPVVSIDNITKPLKSDALASILTLEVYKDRILGASEMVGVPTNVSFLATGNNLNFSGDLPSRVLVARLEPNCERPEEREFEIGDLRAHIRERRRELVCAGLTILQGYYLAGRPPQGVRPFGRFEQWSREIREPIIWAGLPDPCRSRERVIEMDPERDAALAVLSAWRQAIGDLGITAQKLIHWASEPGELREALLEVAADLDHPGQINSFRLGAWCRNRIGRVVGDFKLEHGIADARGGLKTYKVVNLKTQTIVREV